MATKALPSPEVLRQLLSYDPDTGKLFWKERGPQWFSETAGRSAVAQAKIWNGKNAGAEAFTFVNTDGYKRGKLLGQMVTAHRVIMAMECPLDGMCVDHINGEKTDNRRENLRWASVADNSRNYQKPHGSTSQFRGVQKARKGSRWIASISGHNTRRTVYLGTFASETEAAHAYDAAAIAQHGQFATLNFPLGRAVLAEIEKDAAP